MQQVIVERDGHLLTVTLNRPKRKNALTLTSFALLADAWQQASDDPDVRVVILTGAGGSFSSGMDLRSLAGDSDDDGAIDTSRRLKEDPGFIHRGLLKTYRPTKPVIAAIEGVAIAGGTELLLGTDIRVAGESTRIGISEARWSLYPDGGGAVRLPRQIPYTVAADLLLTGRHITAPEAKDAGLVGHVVPDGTALEKAREIAAAISANGPLAVEAILRTLRETLTMPEAEAFAHEKRYSPAVFASADAKEGPRAFAEKRTPVFHRR
jgi:enoyl-CoA hydratase